MISAPRPNEHAAAHFPPACSFGPRTLRAWGRRPQCEALEARYAPRCGLFHPPLYVAATVSCDADHDRVTGGEDAGGLFVQSFGFLCKLLCKRATPPPPRATWQ